MSKKSCPESSEVGITPVGFTVLHAVKQQLGANLKALEHLLVEGADFAFQDVRNSEFFGGHRFARRMKSQEHGAALGADLNEMDSLLLKAIWRIDGRSQFQNRFGEPAVDVGNKRCAKSVELGRAASPQSGGLASIDYELLVPFRRIDLPREAGDQVLRGHRLAYCKAPAGWNSSIPEEGRYDE
jgi:hypothetical protein